MTASITTQNSNIIGTTYSDAELSLIKEIWADTQSISRNQMKLCLHLLDLKEEMDSKDPNASTAGPGTTRFWACFQSGDLPEYVTKKRGTALDWLHAAKYVRTNSLSGAPDKLEALTPSTINNIERIDNQKEDRPMALKVVELHLKNHDFIGHDATSLLSNVKNVSNSDLEAIHGWVQEHPSDALVPSIIRDLQEKVKHLQKENKSLQEKGFVDAEHEIEQQQRYQQMLRDTHKAHTSKAKQREKAKEINAVTDELKRAELEKRQHLDEVIEGYNSHLNATWEATKKLHAHLQTISSVDGTQLLDEARQTTCRGWISIANDIERLQTISELLVKSVRLAQSSNLPTGLSVETIIENMGEE